MLTPAEAMDTTAVTTEGIEPKVVKKVEEATPEVIEVLVEVPKSP